MSLNNYAEFYNDEKLLNIFKGNSDNIENFDNDSESIIEHYETNETFKNNSVNDVKENLILECGTSIDEVNSILNFKKLNLDLELDKYINDLPDDVDKKCVYDNLNDLNNYIDNELNSYDKKNILDEKIYDIKESEKIKEYTIKESKSYDINDFIIIVFFILLIIYIYQNLNQ